MLLNAVCTGYDVTGRQGNEHTPYDGFIYIGSRVSFDPRMKGCSTIAGTVAGTGHEGLRREEGKAYVATLPSPASDVRTAGSSVASG